MFCLFYYCSSESAICIFTGSIGYFQSEMGEIFPLCFLIRKLKLRTIFIIFLCHRRHNYVINKESHNYFTIYR